MKNCDRCGISEKKCGSLQWSGNPRYANQRIEYLCFPCYKEKTRLLGQVNMHRSRARKLGLPDTLTTQEWLDIQSYFNYRCAYCQINKSTCLEHFIPLSYGHGSGTIKQNIVPSCNPCNMKKRNKHPDQVTLIPREDIERVRSYLMSLL